MTEQPHHEKHVSHVDSGSPSHLTHKSQGVMAMPCVVVTCSDSRNPDSDTSGKLICRLLQEQGHTVTDYHLIKDEPAEVRKILLQASGQEENRVVIINGGTGISRRDTTFEAVDAFLEKHLDGFGELFRYLSYKEIGSAAMLSRATAGVHGNLVIFSIPGSQGAVRLAMEQLILPEMGHVSGELMKEVLTSD